MPQPISKTPLPPTVDAAVVRGSLRAQSHHMPEHMRPRPSRCTTFVEDYAAALYAIAAYIDSPDLRFPKTDQPRVVVERRWARAVSMAEPKLAEQVARLGVEHLTYFNANFNQQGAARLGGRVNGNELALYAAASLSSDAVGRPSASPPREAATLF